ncbi:hypothetical protein GCM10010124_21890 [Pilimelia terevasa]|uniref:Guanylate cyclase domain-containing protein n=1 Tax=Pilimelia terevasa TaxID=53372 RepID=A0A8J3BP86_9ACTN|nr:hypothetical protein [Pilimelia terevasa]GGK28793.1 hypothetical protein GCM10010124_21890 [Pilimelia terevasa]
MITPFTEPRPLPDYRAVLAVDAKGFTRRPGSTHADLAAVIPGLVESAMEAAGLADAWAAREFFSHTGDGLATGLPTRIVPHLLHPFPLHLQEQLERFRYQQAAAEPLRMRVALHIGPLSAAVGPYGSSGNGDARNDTHRLLDSGPVREALERHSAHVTLVALIVSDRVFQDVVVPGYTGRHPHHFTPVTAAVAGKDFNQAAWLYLPSPSGTVSAPPQAAPEAGHAGPGPGATAPAKFAVGVNHGQVNESAHGTFHFGSAGGAA